MATFQKTPDGYSITHAGRTITLPTEETYELYAWLHTHANEMFQALHPERNLAATHQVMVQALDALTKQDLPDAVQTWHRAKPAVERYQAEHPLVNEQLCTTCGQPVTDFTVCANCEKPVHMDNNEKCGAWLMDSWHVDAQEMNAFWCSACLQEQEKENDFR